MITLYYEEKERSKHDILYGATPHQTDLYNVDSVTPNDIKELGKPNTFLLMDQTPITSHELVLPAYNNNSTLFLYNKIHKSLEETLEFYELLSFTSGALFAIGHEASTHLSIFQATTNHIPCALEELDYITYPGAYEEPEEREPLFVYTEGKIARYFRNYCLRRWTAEEKKVDNKNLNEDTEDEFVEPFHFVTSPETANTYLTFETLSREVLRMVDNRYRNIYVPHNQVSNVFDPRSFFKANSEHIETMTAGQSEHQSAALLKDLFNAMYDYMIEVFVPGSSVKTMKIPGNIDLFQAIAYNLNRGV